MRTPFRFIGIGLFAVGVILFAPFFFRFLFYAVIIAAAWRLFRYWRYGYHAHCRSHHRHYGSFKDQYDADGIIPID